MACLAPWLQPFEPSLLKTIKKTISLPPSGAGSYPPHRLGGFVPDIHLFDLASVFKLPRRIGRNASMSDERPRDARIG
jgi:hypothetical protein